jgi:hypothetical protein
VSGGRLSEHDHHASISHAYFDHLQDRLQCFCRAEVQVEGWFKGEMLFLLEETAARSEIEAFDREVERQHRRMDLYLTIAGAPNWVELKRWLIGLQRGDRWSPSSYFTDSSSVGIHPDVEKPKALDNVCRLVTDIGAEHPTHAACADRTTHPADSRITLYSRTANRWR